MLTWDVAPHRRGAHHESFHGRHVGIQRALRSGHQRGGFVTERLVDRVDLDDRIRAGAIDSAEPSAADAHCEHPSAIGECSALRTSQMVPMAA